MKVLYTTNQGFGSTMAGQMCSKLTKNKMANLNAFQSGHLTVQSPQTRAESPETVGSTEKFEGMLVEGLNANCCFDDIPDGFQDIDTCDFGDASKDGFDFERPSGTSSPSNSERTLEKWEYLLRTRPRDPM